MGLNGGLQKEVEVNGLELLDDGRIISADNKPVTVKLAENLTIEFRFNYSGESEPSIDSNHQENKLILTLNNFQSDIVMGGTTPSTGILEPILIGTYNYRELYLIFDISSVIQDQDPVVTNLQYNFYLGDELNEGKLDEFTGGESDDGE